MNEDPHAVRWKLRESGPSGEPVWSKWHWTNDSNQTLCNRYISLGSELNFLPDTSDDSDKVSCVCCRNRLQS